MYIVTRADLTPGQQLAQSAHAAFEFSVKYPDIVKTWNDASNNLVCLSTPSEIDLLALSECLLHVGITQMIRVVEPDLDDELTAIAIAPHPEVHRLLSNLPLALKLRAREVVEV